MVLAQIEVLLENSADVSVDLVWFEPVPKSALNWCGVRDGGKEGSACNVWIIFSVKPLLL